MTAREVAAFFPGGKWRGETYETHCSAHSDRHPSLGISPAKNGGVVIHCQAGCDPADVLAAVGLSLKDLAPPPVNGRRPLEPEAVYRYDDERGEPLYEKVRMPGKQFFLRLPGGSGGSIGDVRRVLFGLPELLATKPGETVAIVEGEKDALNVRKRGVAATTNPEGAAKAGQRPKWRAEYTEWLKTNLSDRRFAVFADQDEAGLAHAEAVVASLKAAGLVVVAVNLGGLAEKEDVSDWLIRHTDEEFRALLVPEPHPLLARLLSRDQLRSLPPPIWQIEDLFFEQSIVEIYGESNHGKSLVGMDVGLNLVRGGSWAERAILKAGPVVYVNADGGPGFSPRLLSWEQANGNEAVYEFWTYPRELLLADARQMQEFTEGLAHLPDPPAMVVIDTLSQCIPGVNENQQEDMSRVVAHLNAVKRRYGTTVLLLHHVGKDGLNRGSTVIPGAADTIIRVTKQGDNTIELLCEKQRDGRKFAPIYLEIEVHGVDQGVYLTHKADAPNASERREEREQRVLDALRVNGGWLSREEIRLRVAGMAPASIYRYLRSLLNEDLIEQGERPGGRGQPEKVYLYKQPIERSSR